MAETAGDARQKAKVQAESHQQCDVNYREIRRVKGVHYRMVLRIS